MRQDVTVVFGLNDATEIVIPAGTAIPSADEGRRWLEAEFVAQECEPLRASGKVLTVDKLLAVTQAAGRERLLHDAAFRDGLARAAIAALGKPVVRVDLSSMSVVC